MSVSGYTPGDNLTISVNKTGNNFIWWWWGNSSRESAPNLTKTIFIDNEVVIDNTTFDYYILSDINADEYHIITIRGFNRSLNTLNTTVSLSSKTYEQDIWWLLILGTIILVIGWFTAPLLIMLSIGIYLLGFGMALDMTNQSYILITYGLAFAFSMITFAMRWKTWES
jgi:hypothetical protein